MILLYESYSLYTFHTTTSEKKAGIHGGLASEQDTDGETTPSTESYDGSRTLKTRIIVVVKATHPPEALNFQPP